MPMRGIFPPRHSRSARLSLLYGSLLYFILTIAAAPALRLLLSRQSQSARRHITLPPLLSKPASLCESSKHNFGDASQLACIVTGMEHSGTTIVSRVIMSTDGLVSGFELGFLLADSPSSFRNVPAFYDWLVGPTQDAKWGLSEAQRTDVLQSDCHAEMYAKLRRHSPIFKLNPGSRIVDKTPPYVYSLSAVMDRAPGVPVIVTVKSDDDQIASWVKRDIPRWDAETAVQAAAVEVNRAVLAHPGRIHIVNMTEFAADPSATMARVFKFLGLRWDPQYLLLEGFKQKGTQFGWHHVYAFSPPRVFNRTKATDGNY